MSITSILQCTRCEGTSFEVRSDKGLVTFICKHCGKDCGGVTWDPGVGHIDLGDLAGTEDAVITRQNR